MARALSVSRHETLILSQAGVRTGRLWLGTRLAAGQVLLSNLRQTGLG